MEFITGFLGQESLFPTSRLKLLLELMQGTDCKIPPDTIDLLYHKLLREYRTEPVRTDTIQVLLEKLICLIIEKEQGLQEQVGTQLFPQFLEVNLNTEYIKHCNSVFKTDFSCFISEEEELKECSRLLCLLSSPYLLKLGSTGEGSERSFKLLLHLSVSSREKLLKLVLACLREFTNSPSREDELLHFIRLLESEEVKPAQQGLQYPLLTALYTNSENTPQPLAISYHRREIFWEIVQKGLVHSDPLRRKQSLFLLKTGSSDLFQFRCEGLPTCVAFMEPSAASSELSERWYTVVHLLETFEETQTHLLQASLPLLYSLADFVRVEVTNAHSLHFSWLLTLYHRLFSHESRLVQSWGIHAVLACPLSHSSQTQVARFVTHTLILAMNHPSFFKDSTETLVCSFTRLYSQFIGAYSDTEAEGQLANIFSTLISLSDIPLFYLSYSLSRLASRDVVGSRALLVLRKLLSRTMLSHSHLLRRAIKCFLIRMLTHLINLNRCTWLDVILTLSEMAINLSESAELKELNYFVNKLIGRSNPEEFLKLVRCVKNLVDLYLCALDTYSIDNILTQSLDGEQQLSHTLGIPSKSQNNVELPTKSGVVISYLVVIAETDSDGSCEVAGELDLSPAVQILMNIESHPYLSQERIERALILTNSLIAVTLAIGVTNKKKSSFRMFTALTANLTEVAVHLIEQESSIELKQLLANFREYQLMSGNCSELVWEMLALKATKLCEQALVIPTQQEEEIEISNKTCKLVALIAYLQSIMNGRETLNSILSPAVRKIINVFPLIVEGNIKLLDSTSRVSLFTATLQVIENSSSLIHSLPQIALKQLALVTNASCLVSILHILLPLLPNLSRQDPQLCTEYVSACWLGVREEAKDSEQLHKLFPVFLQACMSRELLLNLVGAEQSASFLSSLIYEVIEWGEKRNGAMYMTVKHFECIWNSSEAVTSMSTHVEHIVKIFLTSNDLNKPVRQQVDAIIFAHRLKEFDFSHWRGRLSQNFSDLYRLELLGILTRVDISEQAGYSSLLAETINELLRVERETSAGREGGCVFNSRFHREKLRIWQTVLLLLASLLSCDSSLVSDRDEKLLFSLLKQHIPSNSQPSIRCYVEWSAALLISHRQSLLSILLAETRAFFSAPGSLVPFVCVSHVTIFSLLLRKISLSTESLREMSALLIALISSNNSQLRHASLDTLHQLKQLAISQELPLVSLLQFCREDRGQGVPVGWAVAIGSELSLTSALEQLPAYFGLEVGQDLGLSELAGRGREEWDEKQKIPLGREATWSNVEKAHKWCVEGSVAEVQELAAREVMQKKIMPWEILCRDDAILTGRCTEEAKSKQKGELILIASLVDKPTNLGGMCRTCEVFGAAGLVISNKKVLTERSFTSLSVSAERWLNIEEVKVEQLPDYIRTLKGEGYTLIGVEQTPSSTSLDKFSFPQRCGLLLGHEKYGIPVHLLELMDT